MNEFRIAKEEVCGSVLISGFFPLKKLKRRQLKLLTAMERRQRGLVQDRCLEMELWLSMEKEQESTSVMVDGNDAIGAPVEVRVLVFCER